VGLTGDGAGIDERKDEDTCDDLMVMRWCDEIKNGLAADLFAGTGARTAAAIRDQIGAMLQVGW
jgi:hypothetical protein